MKVIWRLSFWMNLSTRKTGVRNSHTTFAAIAQHSQYECIHWHQSGKCWRWGKHLLLFIKLRTWWPKTSNDHIMYIRKSPDARRQFRLCPLSMNLAFLTFWTFLWDTSFMLKSYGVVVVGGGLQDFSVSPSPLLGFWGFWVFWGLKVGDYWGFQGLGS